ncbi:MAG: sigma-70 family RNA polymerase sigma factor, partial [Actinobacteria bacterium]|nr:sigma-70 family RNA polymerase sigma factor [Actinomycetota bacterium]
MATVRPEVDRSTQTTSGRRCLYSDHSQPIPNDALVYCYQTTDCRDCLDRLLERNTRLLHHVLKRFQHQQEPYEDLLQVACLGLVKAAQRFDTERGHAFSTFAVTMVDGEIRHHLRDSVLMRQPRWARTAYRKIEEAQTAFYAKRSRFPSCDELSELVNITPEGIL